MILDQLVGSLELISYLLLSTDEPLVDVMSLHYLELLLLVLVQSHKLSQRVVVVELDEAKGSFSHFLFQLLGDEDLVDVLRLALQKEFESGDHILD